MRRYAFLTVLTFVSISTKLLATNGDLMIAVGAKSMGMGGVGIAVPFGAESALSNPALITENNSKELSILATTFFPSIDTKVESVSTLEILNKQGTYQESNSKFYLIPSIAYASHLKDNWYGAVGVWGVAGMGVDFSESPTGSGLSKMKTDLMIMNISTPIAYKSGNFSIGLAPILQVGMLDIEYKALTDRHPYDGEFDVGLGAKVGISYSLCNGLRVGAVYQTPISMEYKSSDNLIKDLKLQQPQEYGVGLSYSFGYNTVAFDWKRVDWDRADGYREFGWKSQDVFAMGWEYKRECWAIRAGYNYGSSPIDNSELQPIQNYLNLLGFPATAENHYTFGGSYSFSDKLSFDLAFVYSPTKKREGVIRDTELRDITIINRHNELSLSLQMNYKF
jgi:long-chain fatty acid transport protein